MVNMPEKKNQQKKDQERKPQPQPDAPKPLREVTVEHLDAPPSAVKRSIHPRRPAPIVPTHEERTGEGADDDSNESSEDR